MVVKFLNRNGLDCRRDNLKICTQLQNQGGRRSIKMWSNRMKGIYELSPGKWMARLKMGAEFMEQGPFCSSIEAANIYNDWAKLLR